MERRTSDIKRFFQSAAFVSMAIFFLVGITPHSYAETPKEILVGGTISVTGPLSKIVAGYTRWRAADARSP